MNDAIEACDIAIESGDPNVVPDAVLTIKPDFRDPEYKRSGLGNEGVSNKQVVVFWKKEDTLYYNNKILFLFI